MDVDVIEDPAAAIVALDPVRARLLAELATPGSASTLAPRVGLARQKVNYHLRLLEAHGLVKQVEKRRWGGLTERFVQATAASYVVSPSAMGLAACDPGKTRDRLSARYLVARYHDASAPGGRWHRLVVAAHPMPIERKKEEAPCPS